MSTKQESATISEAKANHEELLQGENTSPIGVSKKEAEGIIKDAVEARVHQILDTYEQRIATDKASIISVFGVFASVVAFVSFEIQAFKTLCTYSKLAGFTLILLGSLLTFNLILHYLAKTWVGKDDTHSFFERVTKRPEGSIIFLMSILLIAFGVWTSKFGNEETCRENLIYQRFEVESNKKQIDFESKFGERINQIENQNNINSKKIDELSKTIK